MQTEISQTPVRPSVAAEPMRGGRAERGALALAVGGLMVVLIAMTYWGGTAAPGPLFWLGVGVLASTWVMWGVLVGWLFFSPITETVVARTDRRTLEVRQFMALMAAVSGLLFITGGLWDEIWHRLYGNAAVLDDFMWRPHQLLYGSMGINALIMFAGLALALQGQGGLRARFRAEPLLGILGLASTYMMLSAPSDLLWHKIYGLDITAWSLPHLILVGGVALTLVCAARMQMSLLPRPTWQGLRGMRSGEFVVLIMLCASLVLMMQVAVTEWEGMRARPDGVGTDPFVEAFWSRPEWLYPVVLVALALLLGNIALHSLRRPGVATLVALGVLGFRVLVSALFRAVGAPLELALVSQVLIVIPALALDVWYAVQIQQADTLRTRVLGNALAVCVFMAVGLPLIPQFLLYPRINAETVPWMVVLGLIVGAWAGWLGSYIGAGLAEVARPAQVSGKVSARAAWASAGAVLAFALFTVYFVLTATPPVE